MQRKDIIVLLHQLSYSIKNQLIQSPLLFIPRPMRVDHAALLISASSVMRDQSGSSQNQTGGVGRRQGQTLPLIGVSRNNIILMIILLYFT